MCVYKSANSAIPFFFVFLLMLSYGKVNKLQQNNNSINKNFMLNKHRLVITVTTIFSIRKCPLNNSSLRKMKFIKLEKETRMFC